MSEVENVGFKIQIPQGCGEFHRDRINRTGRLNGIGEEAMLSEAFSSKLPSYPWAGHNVELYEYFDGSAALREARKGADGQFSFYVTQELSSDGKTKVTTVRPKDVKPRGSFKMVQVLEEDGTYTCRRIGNGVEKVKQIKPKAKTKALTGFKGKLEKMFMSIAQDANGCERPILRNISGKAIQILRRIK